MIAFVTGAAGFIGYHLCMHLLDEGHQVVGFDGLTDYYDTRLKRARLDQLQARSEFIFVEAMLENADRLTGAVADARPDVIMHLAAQAGVRYSIDHPQSYISSNLVGTANLLEAAKAYPPRHLMFASTSSIYGGNQKVPFAEIDRADSPVSLYAATKKAGEAMTHSYAHLWNIPTTCFRLFTAYGPWGRPDMALFKFVSAIEQGKPIDVYGDGELQRDFTYVEDIVAAIVALSDQAPVKGRAVGQMDSLSPAAPWRTVNIAGGKMVGLLEFIATIEMAMDKRAIRNPMPTQPGDMERTVADTSLLKAMIGTVPETDLTTGVAAFVRWYRDSYLLLNRPPA